MRAVNFLPECNSKDMKLIAVNLLAECISNPMNAKFSCVFILSYTVVID